MNPFMMGLLSMTGAQNPEMFSSAMANLGFSPDSMGQGQSGMSNFMGYPQGDPLGGFITGMGQPQAAPAAPQPTVAGWEATVNPADQSGGAQPPAPGNMLAGLGGAKMPQAPQPIMSGGVAGGGQPAPGMKVQAGNGALANAIMQLISGAGNQDPLRVPALGTMIRGGTYG